MMTKLDTPASRDPSGRASTLGIVAACLLGSVTILSCSSGSPAPAPVDLAAFCPQWAAARCPGIQTCCTQAAGKYADAAACATGEQTLCEATLLPTLSNPQYVYDAAAAGVLIARVRAAGKGCGEAAGPLGIAQVLKPGVEPGGACDLAQAVVLPCKESYCKTDSATPLQGTCVPLPLVGQACPDGVCAAGSACTVDPASAEMRCTLLPAAGQKCQNLGEVCSPTLSCRPTPEALRAFYGPGATGQELLNGLACLAPRANGMQAYQPEDCASGLVTLARITPTCVACTNNVDCLYDGANPNDVTFSIDDSTGYCEGGVCHDGASAPPASKPEGARCLAAAECRSLRCDGKTASAYGLCGPPDVDRLFCTTPLPGGAVPDGGTVIDAGAAPDRAAAVDAPNDGCATTNFALGATATAQSTYSGYSAAHVVDGDRSTALGQTTSWANDYNPPSTVLPQWLEIDFGVDRTFSRVDVFTTASYPIKDYDVTYWDGLIWTTIVSARGNVLAHVAHHFSPLIGSKVRIVGISGPDIQTGYARLNEVEVCHE
jgi:hypothetical protein